VAILHADYHDIGDQLGFTRNVADLVGCYLRDEGLIEFHTFGPMIGITHCGVKEVENALSEPDVPSEYFPAVNIISVGQMINSQVQQNSPHASQMWVHDLADYESLDQLVKRLEKCSSELELSSQERAEIHRHVQTIKTQMASSEPKVDLIQKCLGSVKRILEGMVGSILASELLREIQLVLPQ